MDKSMKLYDKICNSTIKLSLRSKKRNGILKELVSLLPMDENAKNILLTTLVRREDMGSTGVGMGIAIPHARSLLVKEFKLVIGLSRKGVLFDSYDGKPVHLFFLIIAPPQETSNSYLITLGKVAELAKNIAKDKRLFSVTEENEFFKIIKELEEKGR
ncbi:PTS sugar transporter subunit IIA [candidate division WOR-3 bacterium]|nr:PTS sugar transporter subunit IIA [candidate division WOR-3 bacterium]